MSDITDARLPLTPADQEILDQLNALPDRIDNTYFITKFGGVIQFDQVATGGVTATNGVQIISGSVGLGSDLVQHTTIDGQGIYSFSLDNLKSFYSYSVNACTISGATATFGTNTDVGHTRIVTPNIQLGAATNGQALVLVDDTTGEVEYQDVASTSSVDTINYTASNTGTFLTGSNTYYMGFVPRTAISATESAIESTFGRDVIVTEFLVSLNTPGSGFTGNTTVTLRKNGIDTAYSVVAPTLGNNATKNFLVSCGESFSSTDLISYSIVTDAGTGSIFPSVTTRVQTASTPIPDTFTRVTATITAAQMADIFNTPIEIVPAVVGKTIVPISSSISFGNTPFTFTGGTGSWRVGLYGKSPYNYTWINGFLQDNSSGILSNSAFNNTTYQQILNTSTVYTSNTAITLTALFNGAGTAPTIAAGSDLLIDIVYRLI